MHDGAAVVRRRIAAALVVVGIALGAGAVVLWATTRSPLGEAPMVAAPVSATPQPTSAQPRPGTPTPTQAPLADISGVPVHVTVLQQGTPLIEAEVAPIQLDGKGWLTPDRGLAGWYGPPQWDTVPGNLSAYRGIIVGHNVTGSGTKDVFYNLGQARAGDRVVVTYALDDGEFTTAEFTVTQDASTVPKQDVVTKAETDYKWVWQSDTPERVLSLFSCDIDAAHVDGHSLDNWIVTAKRIL